jgi:hypothetical protein
MKRYRKLFIKNMLIYGVLLLFLPLLVYGGDEFTEKELQKLNNGKFIAERMTDSSGCKGLQLQFTVAASRERIWEVLADNSMIDKLSGDLDKMKILEETGESARVRFWIKVLFKKYNYILHRTFEKNRYRISWHRDSGDFEIIKGSWEISTFSRGWRGLPWLFIRHFLIQGIPSPALFPMK